MYFALGFLAAGLFALMLLPALWRRAVRLSMRRLHMLAPLSQEEAAAERDLLRAESAMRYRRLEQQMAALKAAKAQDLAEIGRRAARIAGLDAELAAANAHASGIERELRETQRVLSERTSLLASTEAALHELTDRLERKIAMRRDPDLAYSDELAATRVAAHESKVVRLHDQNVKMRQELEKLENEFARVSSQALRLVSADASSSDAAHRLEAALAEKADLRKLLDEERARLFDIEKRQLAQIEKLEGALRIARADGADRAKRIEAAHFDAMVQGAIDALRREHNLLREARAVAESASLRVLKPLAVASIAPAHQRADKDMLALREAISALGARMAELSGAEPAASSAPEAAASKRAL